MVLLLSDNRIDKTNPLSVLRSKKPPRYFHIGRRRISCTSPNPVAWTLERSLLKVSFRLAYLFNLIRSRPDFHAIVHSVPVTSAVLAGRV